MDYTLKSLICFKKAAELEHMTRAADALYISQAQLSRIIADLERQFGAQFFDRSSKGIKLNACGRVFYKYVQQMLELTNQAQKKVREAYLHELSQVTITSNCGAYMPGIVHSLLKAAPELKFRELEVTQDACVSSLKEGTSDFAICCPIISDLDITSRVLIRETPAVLYPAGHWLDGRKTVSIFELADEKFIGQLNGYGDRDSFDAECRRINFEPNYVVETGEAFQISRMVDSGLGIAIIPRSVIRGRASARYVEIEESLSGEVGLSWLAERELSQADRLFMDIISDFFEQLNQM